MSGRCGSPWNIMFMLTACCNIEITKSQLIFDVPNVTIPNLAYAIGYGHQLTIECIIVSTPNYTDVYWQKLSNGTVSNISSTSPNIEGAMTSQPRLTFKRVTTEDTGQYICFAVNIIGSGQSEPTNLTVLGGEIIITASEGNLTILYGSEVTLDCSVKYDNTYDSVHVSWNKSRHGHVTTVEHTNDGNDRIKLSWYAMTIPMTSFVVANYVLTMKSLSFNDSGRYWCFAFNQFSNEAARSFYMKIIGGVPNVTLSNLAYAIAYGNYITLECTIVSTPYHNDVYWQHISNGTTRNITSPSPSVYGASVAVPSLTIRRVTTKDSGQYICFAVNNVGTGQSEPTTLTVLGDVPRVKIPNLAYNLDYGNDLTLECVIISTPYHFNVYWQKLSNGTITNITSDIPGVHGATMTQPSLTIFRVTLEASGQYTCFAVNIAGTGKSEPTTVTVIGDVPSVFAEPGPYRVKYGETAMLLCNITSVPKCIHVHWIRVDYYGFEMFFPSFNTEDGSKHCSPLLVIANVSYDHAGNYYCVADNDLGSSKSGPVTLLVYGGKIFIRDLKLPLINIEKDQYVVQYRSSLTIHCSVLPSSETPVLEIFWTSNINGVIYPIDGMATRISESSIESPSLTIFNMTSSDSGTYNIYARNKFGTAKSRPINVTVTGSVPIVHVRDTRYSRGYGETVTMVCNIDSDLAVTNVYWEKEFQGRKTVINHWTVGIKGVSLDVPSLTIMKTTTSDIATYRCVATNDIGTGYSKITRLDVIGELPTVSVTADLPTAKYGDKVHILCNVTAMPRQTEVYWVKQSDGSTKVINNETTGTDGITVANPSLILIHTTDSDSGIYRCFAVNEFGMGYSLTIELTVIGGLPEVSVPSITHLTGIGYTVTLSCSVKNPFPPISKVYWERLIHGSITRLESDSIGIHGITVENPSLIIPSAMESMTGEYTCFGVNSVGTGRSFPASLTVKAGVTPVTTDIHPKAFNDEEDYTDTIVNGIIAAVAALAGVGSLVIAFWAFKHSQKTGDARKSKKLRISTNQRINVQVLSCKNKKMNDTTNSKVKASMVSTRV
ncbi:hemicentin-1-like [Mytilus edulis]|uniref:hemicentin-1-like n=1 Tax=Mytilus edulis TaxID=6550 RepID=UPI0039EED8BD